MNILSPCENLSNYCIHFWVSFAQWFEALFVEFKMALDIRMTGMSKVVSATVLPEITFTYFIYFILTVYLLHYGRYWNIHQKLLDYVQNPKNRTCI